VFVNSLTFHNVCNPFTFNTRSFEVLYKHLRSTDRFLSRVSMQYMQSAILLWQIHPSVCLSVCLSNAGTVSIRMNISTSELTMGQWVMGHRSNESTNLAGSRRSRVSTRDPLL